MRKLIESWYWRISKHGWKVMIIVFVVIMALLVFPANSFSDTSSDELTDLLQKTILVSAALASDGFNVVHLESDRLSEGSYYTLQERFMQVTNTR